MVTWRLMYGSSSGSGYSSEYALVDLSARAWRRGGVAGFGLGEGLRLGEGLGGEGLRGEGGVNHWPTDMLPSGLVCTFMRVCVGYMCGVLVYHS